MLSDGDGNPRLHIDSTGAATFSGVVKANHLTTSGDSLYFLNDTNATATSYINFYGYQGGVTQFRNTVISNGKGSPILTLDGASQAATFSGAVTATGGVYLGGTGAANHLDDYEEGTWTPTPNVGTFSSTSCSYTKVGRLVTLTFDAVVGTGGGSTIQAPITALKTTAAGIYTSLQDFQAGRTTPTIIIGGSTTIMYFRDIGDNVSATGMVLTAGATITFTLSYIIA